MSIKIVDRSEEEDETGKEEITYTHSRM